MKFRLPIAAPELKKTVEDCLTDYNAGRNVPKLFMHMESCTDDTLVIREGKAADPRGAVRFSARLTPDDSGISVEGEVRRAPARDPHAVRAWRWRTVLSFLAVTVIPWGIVRLLMFLFESDLPFVDWSVPLFTGLCYLFCLIRDELWITRRFARLFIAYMGAEQVADVPRRVPSKKKKNGNRPAHLRHVLFWLFFRPGVKLYLRLKLHYHAPKCPKLPRGNFIMMGNHTTDYDMLCMGVSMPQMYFVMSEHALRKGFVSKLLLRYFDPIPRPKGGSGSVTVLELMRRARQGYNTALFPEGFRTLSGYNKSFAPSTGALVRRMKCHLVTFRLKGGFYTHPNWGTGIRPGKMWGEISGVYTADQLAAMTDEEVNDVIARGIYEDASATQAEVHVAYKAKKKGAEAEGLEHSLFVCPVCHALGRFRTRGRDFRCDCGARGTYTDYGELVSEDFPFSTISDWYRWQEKFVAELPDKPDDEVLLRAENQNLLSADTATHTDVALETGATLTVTPVGFSVGEHSFLFSELAFFDIIRHGFLVFTTKDGSYYEVVNPDAKFPGMLVKMLYYRYGPDPDTFSAF